MRRSSLRRAVVEKDWTCLRICSTMTSHTQASLICTYRIGSPGILWIDHQIFAYDKDGSLFLQRITGARA